MEKVYTIFPTPIWKIEAEVPKGGIKWAIEYKKNNPSIERSNRGGYQSNAKSRLDGFPYTEELVKKLINLPKFTLNNWWLNINRKGDFNHYHTHPCSDLSGIWYFTDNNNSLRFIDSNIHTRNALTFCKELNYNTCLEWDATAGTIIVFPSDLQHAVEPHKLRTPRISIAFNLNINAE